MAPRRSRLQEAQGTREKRQERRAKGRVRTFRAGAGRRPTARARRQGRPPAPSDAPGGARARVGLPERAGLPEQGDVQHPNPRPPSEREKHRRVIARTCDSARTSGSPSRVQQRFRLCFRSPRSAGRRQTLRASGPPAPQVVIGDHLHNGFWARRLQSWGARKNALVRRWPA